MTAVTTANSHAEHQHQGRDLLPVERGEGIDNAVDVIAGLRRRRGPVPYPAPIMQQRQFQRSAPPRMSAQPPDVPLRRRCRLYRLTNHWDITLKENRAERVQIVNAGDGGEVLRGVGRSASERQVGQSPSGSAFRTSSSRLMRLSAVENARSACPTAGITTHAAAPNRPSRWGRWHPRSCRRRAGYRRR